MQHPAPFVWTDGEGLGRMSHVYFRHDLTLAFAPKQASIHLFADSNYHLRVNGEFIGFGPIRFYPENPEFDTYDLTPYLRPGKNVIAVHALQVGIATFHHIFNRGGFTAWGEVVAENGDTFRLDTPGGWLCTAAPGYDLTAPKFSFAQAPYQAFDERLGICNWDGRHTDLSGWQPPILIENQNSWGEFAPRSIPPLESEERLPKTLLSAHRHGKTEEIHSFRMTHFGAPRQHEQAWARGLAYTYIHSPHEQSVTTGLYWGEHSLNGQPVEKAGAANDNTCRTDHILNLQAGWNFFFVSYGIVNDTWDFQLALPRAAGLALSPTKTPNDSVIFMTAGPISDFHDVVVPGASHHDLPELTVPWEPKHKQPVPILPVKHLAWIPLEGDLGLPGDQVQNLTADSGVDTSFFFDMGGEVLGRIFVEYDAPPGAVIDIAIAEEMDGDRIRYFKGWNVFSADRQIAAGGPSRMETFYPRGFRYCHLAVVNHTGPVKITKFGVVTQTYPHQKIGAFQCSDPLLSQIWEMGWRTLRVCSEDVYTDCPWRERTLYAGDMLPESATALVASGDTMLVRRCLDLFLQSQSENPDWQQSMAPMQRNREPLSDYPLITLLTTDWYVRYTGDLAFAEHAYPRFRAMMEYALTSRDASGLFALHARPFIEHGHNPGTGFSGALNALFVRSWTAIGDLADFLGHSDDAARYRLVSAETAVATRKAFWSPEHGAFANGLVDGTLMDERSGVTSAWCSLFGVTTPGQEVSLMSFYQGLLDNAKPGDNEPIASAYASFYLLGGLYTHGQAEFAENFMRRSWKPMVDAGSDTIWEHFDSHNSLAHAWSTAPNYYLSTRVLGVRLGFPEETDFDTILIAPQAETIDWASGTVPHPRGPVSVNWKVEGTKLVMTCKVPEGVKWRVEPVGRLAGLELWVNESKC